MEGGDVRVVDDGTGGESGPWDPARSWWVAAATAIGVVAAVVLLISTLRSNDQPPSDAPEVTPAAPTSTTQAIATTTNPQTITTTTSLGRVIRDIAAFMGPDIRSFCIRASPFVTDRILEVEEWVESLDEDDWILRHGDVVDAFESNVSEAGEAVDVYRRTLLESVSQNLRAADSALHDAVNAAHDGDHDEWLHQVARIEIFCAKANATVSAMVAMSHE